MSQPFAVAQVFTGIEGRLVSLKDTIQAFKQILAGDHDALPESAFYSELRCESVAMHSNETVLLTRSPRSSSSSYSGRRYR